MRASFVLFVTIISFCAISSSAKADPAAPRDELFRLVPEDTTFCVVIQDLRNQSAQVKKNPLAEQLAKMPFVEKSLQSAAMPKLMQIFKDLDITPEQLRDDILGDAIVFAFRQPTGKKPAGQDEGVFLVWARDKALLAKLIGKINDFQKKSGELKKVEEAKHQNQAYFRRIKEKDKGADEFYFIRGQILAFSSQEEVIKQVIDADLTAKPVEKQAPLWTTRYTEMAVDPALMTWMVNPRAFDGEIHERSEKAIGSQKAFLQEFEKYWKAIDGVALSINVQKDFEVNFSIRVRTQDMPKAARRFFQEMGKSSEVWNAIPDDCLFAMSSRTDIAALAEVFSGFCDESTRNKVSSAIMSAGEKFLGRGNLQLLGSELGPDWGFWIAPPFANDKTWVPQLGFALKIKDSESGRKAEKAILTALNKLLVFAEFTPGIKVETTKQGEVEIRSIHHEEAFPAGFRPSFAAKNHYLLFASSPGVIERFELRNPIPAKTDGEVPFLRISAKSWREYLQTNRKEVADFLARTQHSDAGLFLPQIDAIAENLKILDRFEITTRSQPDRAILTIRLRSRLAK